MRLCFHFENKDVEFWSGNRIDLSNWLTPAKAFGISEIAIIDLSDARYAVNDQFFNIKVFDSFEEFFNESDGDKYLVDLPRNTGTKLPIKIGDAWLCFGRAGGWNGFETFHVGLDQELYAWQSFIYTIGYLDASNV